ncbi:MAG: hypothetical protein Q8M76_11190, partial [Spirochaetaceae bacterium]|nr:hypothetical protein [Spirochaetaceae bacterium]
MASLNVSIQSPAARFIGPDAPVSSEEISLYRITCTNTSTEETTTREIPPSATESGPIYLDPGTYDVVVDAIRREGEVSTVIGRGGALAVVVGIGDVAKVAVSVSPLAGTGALVLTGWIEPGSVGAGTWNAALDPIVEGTAYSWPLTPNGSDIALNVSGIPAGY